MLRQSDSFPSLLEQLALRAHATPNFLGQGIGASVATHVLAVGGYSLYLWCATWLASADLPQWMPPQSGVRSRPQVSSQTIMLEATFSEALERKPQSIVMQAQRTSLPTPQPPPEAVDTLIERRDNDRPSLAQRSEPELPDTISDHQDVAANSENQRTRVRETDRESLETRRAAHVSKRGHGVAVRTMTSVASIAARESHGAETEALPQKVFSPEPEYPAAEYAAGLGGRVRIRIRLGENGRVIAASIYQASGVTALDQAALEAVRQWRFEPSSSSRPTVRELVVPIRFVPPS